MNRQYADLDIDDLENLDQNMPLDEAYELEDVYMKKNNLEMVG